MESTEEGAGSCDAATSHAVALYVAVHPEEELTAQDIAGAMQAAPDRVDVELERLVDLGILVRRDRGPEGGAVALRSEPSAWLALRGRMCADLPASEVLRAALADVAGIQDAWIYGSTATGDDRADSDIDIVIVGSPDARRLARRLIDAEMLLGRELHANVMTAAEWAAASRSTRPFFRALASGPRRWLVRTGALVGSIPVPRSASDP